MLVVMIMMVMMATMTWMMFVCMLSLSMVLLVTAIEPMMRMALDGLCRVSSIGPDGGLDRR